MVRLKADIQTPIDFTTTSFQFQYGAIKSIDFWAIPFVKQEFQFQYGAIKRLVSIRETLPFKRFQFQYGAIKSFRGEALKTDAT